MTRMRFVLNDESKADVAGIEDLPSAKGSFTQSGQFQVIIGNDVKAFYEDFVAVSGIEGVTKDAAKAAAKQNQNPIQRAMTVIAEVFAPIIPAIIVGGLILGFRNCIDSVYVFGDGTQTLVQTSQFWAGLDSFLWLIGEAVFHTGIPVGICWSVTKKMGGTPMHGIVLGLIGWWLGSGVSAIVYAGITGPFRAIFGAIFGALYAPLVITGLHHMSNAIDLQLIADFGGTMLWPMIALSNIAQGSAVLGMAFLQRSNDRDQQVNIPAIISCYLGVTEPAMFGVNLKYTFPFVCGMVGSCIAGLLSVATSCTANAVGVGGLPASSRCSPRAGRCSPCAWSSPSSSPSS